MIYDFKKSYYYYICYNIQPNINLYITTLHCVQCHKEVEDMVTENTKQKTLIQYGELMIMMPQNRRQQTSPKLPQNGNQTEEGKMGAP